jgi:uncharacterized protein YfaS (alpha-2-macroglobulin family)
MKHFKALLLVFAATALFSTNNAALAAPQAASAAPAPAAALPLPPPPAASIPALWETVKKHTDEQRPQSALLAIEKIIPAALAQKDYDNALRAILGKAAFASASDSYRENRAVQIRVLTPYLKSAAPELRPLLAAAIANVCQAYYNENRHRLLDRTRAAANLSDFRTWDASLVREQIASLYAIALADSVRLQSTPVTAFASVLATPAETAAASGRTDSRFAKLPIHPDTYRPTLFDFIARDAIKFYSDGEAGGTQSEDQFELLADSPALGSLEEFLAWDIPANSAATAASGKLQPYPAAIRLHQALLRFHRDTTKNDLALADADLRRILWANNAIASAPDNRARTEQALRAHIERWKNYEPASDAAADLALLLSRDPDDLYRETASVTAALEAFKTATLGVALHPASLGANRCRAILAVLQARALDEVTTEAVWNAPASQITVTAKNLETVHFRAVPSNWNLFLASDRNRPNSLNKEEFARLRRSPHIKAWSATLPRADYTRATHSFPAPDGLKPGFYFLLASADPTFSGRSETIRYVPFWVSDLALVFGGDIAKQPADGDYLAGFVLNAVTGEPVAGATIAAWSLDGNRERTSLIGAKTDATGAFLIKTRRALRDVLLLATSPDGSQHVSNDASERGYYAARRISERTRHYVHFITDRSLYRPGQPVAFKAVVFTANTDTNEYTPATNHNLTVAIDDPNGKEAARLTLRTNGFGSAHGSFVVPAGRLNGSYSLHTIGAENGRGYVSIEEYKRPKFEVVLAAPATAPRLGDSVTLSGVATAYTGAPIDGAKVRWHVERVTRWPIWWHWRMPRNTATRAIARGVAGTDAQGRFTLTFPASPDKTSNPKNEPQFHFRVTAEITDNTGETRVVTRTVAVGYTALQANLSAAVWQTPTKPVAIEISTTALDGSPLAAEGSLTLYSLKQPERPIRKDASSHALHSIIENEANAPGDPRNWEEGDGVASERFKTDAKGKATVSTTLPAGIYRAVLTTQDRYGKSVTARSEITVSDPVSAKAVVRVPFGFAVEKEKLRPGETFTALWRTGYETGRALVSIEHRGKILQRFWTDPTVTQQKITLPVTENLRGGFLVRILQIRENRFYNENLRVAVPWDNKELKFAWSRFNSKLVPGGRETWTLRIQNPDTGPAAAELAAALYDASLDAYAHHNWNDLGNIFYSERHFWNDAMRFGNIRLRSNVGFYKQDTETPHQRTRVGYRNWGLVPRLFYVRDTDDRTMFNGVSDSYGGGAGGGVGIGISRGFGDGRAGVLGRAGAAPVATAAPASFAPSALSAKSASASADSAAPETADAPDAAAAPSLAGVAARRNLSETAFFYPALVAEADGSVRLEFTAPEALTRWKFLAFAHDKQLRSGVYSDASIVTAKDLMVQPNPPRFVREGDTLEVTVKLTNKTDAPQEGRVSLRFADALTLDSADARLGNAQPERAFTLAPRSSASLSWRVSVPDGTGFLTYKAVAAAGLLSDGEEGFLPVLSRRRLVTESIALNVPAAAVGTPAGDAVFSFGKLLRSGSESSLTHESLTVQIVSNPAWYAVMSLPYLMEHERECNEQIFSRLYANSLAAHIANSDPKIARVFERWRNTPALDSPLFKNTDLKSLLISETPWVRAAEGESAQRRNLAVLFDKNRLDAEMSDALRRLAQRQGADGRWSWFPGCDPNDFISRHIVAGFGKLRRMGVTIDDAVAVRALPALDKQLARKFADIKTYAARTGTDYRKQNHLSTSIAHHLYTRAFFQREHPVAKANLAALDFFLAQAATYWTTQPRQSQAQLALALHRFAAANAGTAAGGFDPHVLAAAPTPTLTRAQADAAATLIIRSLREHAKRDAADGMHWEDDPDARGWYWWQAPIETQALMIELFADVAKDAAAVAEMQLWLLQQKRAQAWPTTKATADAIYALLLGGAAPAPAAVATSSAASPATLMSRNTGSVGAGRRRPVALLSDNTLVSASVGGRLISPKNVEAGTGFYSERIAGPQIKPEMGRVSVTRPASGVAWGSVTWQYFQTLDKITSHAGTQLSLKKTLWKKVRGPAGFELVPAAQGKLTVGDTLVARLELTSEKTMEFMHLKDERPSGAEPVSVLSGYRWRDGLGHYESTKDTATHFFIDWLPAGVHVFEYEVKIVHRGLYQSGIAEIQSMYAPEYNAHSAAISVTAE